jgi:hypothetical protein
VDISVVTGEAKQEFIELEEDWTSSEFNTLKEASDFALARGWTAKPQTVQVRNTNGKFIVERFDGTGCGCGG